MSRLRDRFGGRPDSEHEQALVCLVVVAIPGVYLVIRRHSPDALFAARDAAGGTGGPSLPAN